MSSLPDLDELERLANEAKAAVARGDYFGEYHAFESLETHLTADGILALVREIRQLREDVELQIDRVYYLETFGTTVTPPPRGS